jgi:hypothetical protein
MDNQKNLPRPETDLPEPEKDLPLPEKELGSGAHNSVPSQKNKKNKSKWIISIIILILVLLLASAGGYFVFGRSDSEAEITPTPEEQVVCTQEVMLCPDGDTYVGRVAPSCEFETCPQIVETEPETENSTPTQEQTDIIQEPLPTTPSEETNQ